jgi:hypothetical protein
VIRVSHVPAGTLHLWCEQHLRGRLRPDVSGYARGRLRCWLGEEPHLGAGRSRPGVEVDAATWERLEGWIGWRFDYCLVTYSGTETAAGILPHRDAAYADYEAVGWNLSGFATFRYWEGRKGLGRMPDVEGYSENDLPTHTVEMTPGTLVHFNSKNLHACQPSVDRWAMNFWRAKSS